MKTMVKEGKAVGMKLNCDDCHKDDEDYAQLAKDAHQKLDKLLAAIKR